MFIILRSHARHDLKSKSRCLNSWRLINKTKVESSADSIKCKKRFHEMSLNMLNIKWDRVKCEKQIVREYETYFAVTLGRNLKCQNVTFYLIFIFNSCRHYIYIIKLITTHYCETVVAVFIIFLSPSTWTFEAWNEVKVWSQFRFQFNIFDVWNMTPSLLNILVRWQRWGHIKIL